MDTQKQAYYLSRAGVETGAYAYQSACTGATMADDVSKAASFTNVDSFVSILQNSDEIVSSDNYIWLIPSSDSTENDGTEWQGLTFTATDTLEAPPSTAIGYFTIELVRGYQTVIVEQATETTEAETTEKECVEIRCTAVCLDDKHNPASSTRQTHISSGYVFPSETVNSGIYCDSEGNLLNDGDSRDANGKYTGVFDYCSDKMTVDYKNVETPVYGYTSGNGFFKDLMNNFVSFFKNLYNGLVSDLFQLMTEVIPADEFYVYGKYSSGDLTITTPTSDSAGKPIEVDTLKIQENEMGFYVFSSSGNLKVEPDVNVATSNGKYATVAFYGSDIVLEGDINMAVYYTGTSDMSIAILGNITDTLNSIFDTFQNRYRLGTVVIGASTESGGEWYEYLDKSKGGITTKTGEDNIENANRVFFNGNVSVSIYSQGGTTETYRVFNSGDVYLFNGSYVLSEGKDENGNDDDSKDVRGVDLMKFFLDAVIADYGDFKLGTTAADKMKEIRDLYYGQNSEPYFKDLDGNGSIDTNPMRKLEVVYGTDAVTIDKLPITSTWDKSNKAPLANYIIQPSPTSSLNIFWGKPTISGFDSAES